MEKCDGDFLQCEGELHKAKFPLERLFFKRCHRAGLGGDDLKRILEKLSGKVQNDIETFYDRLYTAWMIAAESAEGHGCDRYGFKLNIPSVNKAHELFPRSLLVYILRDPRDVVASHIQRNFDRTIPEICKAWCNYSRSFTSFEKLSPSLGMMIRYEDIVSEPRSVIPKVLSFLRLPLENSVFEFYRSKAGVHTRGHPNARNLKKDFFTSSIGRWKKELKHTQIEQIEEMCCVEMKLYRYR
jgi:hypothetical protein